MKINNLPTIEWISLSSYTDITESVLITSHTSEKLSKGFLKGLNIKKIVYVTSTQKNDVEKLSKTALKYPVFYAVGGGAVNDIARYLAFSNNAECIAIPTIISTDTLFVDCTGLRNKGKVDYILSKRFDKILLDEKLLNRTKWGLHLSGLGDVLSIYTALFDWEKTKQEKKLQKDEPLTPFFYKAAHGILEGIFSSVDLLKKPTKESYMIILSGLYNEVSLCNCFGNSRPEEGSEHFFVYALENYWKQRNLHGQVVALGIVITSALQGQDFIKVDKFFKEVGFNYKSVKIPQKIILEVFQNIQKYVTHHKLRNSFLNNYKYNEKELRKILGEINYGN